MDKSQFTIPETPAQRLEVRMWSPNSDLEKGLPVAGILALDPLTADELRALYAPEEERRGVYPAASGSIERQEVTRPTLWERVRVVGRCLRDLWQALVALVGIARAAESEDIADSILARQPADAQWKMELINEYIAVAQQRAFDRARRDFEAGEREVAERRQQIEQMQRRYHAAVARREAHGS
jgi:hypothetical protein